MANMAPDRVFTQAAEALSSARIPLTTDAVARLREHLAWVRQWNEFGNFVSAGDLERLPLHVLDSLSLAPYIIGSKRWLDVGPGAGFPAIPVAIVAPETELVMIERSERKAGLLLGVIARLGLERTKVLVGSFPSVAPPWVPDVVTARAVERPAKLHPAIAQLVRGGSCFLCQGNVDWWRGEVFHVEQLTDLWQDAGLRRGQLHRVTCRH